MTGIATVREDKILKCVECRADFSWSASEQQFYAEQGFQNEPKRCRECRKNKKHSGNGSRDRRR